MPDHPDVSQLRDAVDAAARAEAELEAATARRDRLILAAYSGGGWSPERLGDAIGLPASEVRAIIESYAQ